MADPSVILQVQGLRFTYPGQAALFDGWSASIGAGITLLYGDTGSGKSTLLRVLAGRLWPTAGGLSVAGIGLADDAETYGRNVFFCDPTTEQYHEMTARECTASLSAGDAHFDEARWRATVEGFRLQEHLDKPAYMLSTGSKRKLWLAAALASGRVLTLLDEPTGALDAGSIRCLWEALADIAAQGERAVVVASSERVDRVPLASSIELQLRRR